MLPQEVKVNTDFYFFGEDLKHCFGNKVSMVGKAKGGSCMNIGV